MADVQDLDEERQKLYEIPLVAADMPAWVEAPVVSVRQVLPHVRELVVGAEISRHFVSVENVYTTVGQRASVRLPGTDEASAREVRYATHPPTRGAPPMCGFHYPTHYDEAREKRVEVQGVLWDLRGDLMAGESKKAQQFTSIRRDAALWVDEREAPELYALKAGDAVELGPAVGGGLKMEELNAYLVFKTILVFASGDGIATAKSLLDNMFSQPVLLNYKEVRLYYQAPDPTLLAYPEDLARWGGQDYENYVVRTVVANGAKGYDGHVGDFESLYHADDLVYDPEDTGAVVCVPKDQEAAVVKFLVEEAEVDPRRIVLMSEDKDKPIFVTNTMQI